MAKQIINVGAAPNDGTGDLLRNAFIKTNDNFTEVYDGKQNNLVSGTNIKTINSTSILGSGNISTASVNSTSGRLPYNNGGVFADSGYYFSTGTTPFTFTTGIGVNADSAIIGTQDALAGQGIFKAVSGFVTIGQTSGSSIGVDYYDWSFYVGSLLCSGAPASGTPVKWLKVVDESYDIYYIPLYS
jgi:hypothetical protein